MSDINPTPVPPALPTPDQPPEAPPAPGTRDNRGSIVVGGILIVIGAVFLFVNVFRIDFGEIWPIIFFIIGAGFYLPVLLMPRDRRNLAGLLIPGTILFGLGAIFFYNILADNWGSWAYIWTLIPASVGLGLLLAARVGRLGRRHDEGGLLDVRHQHRRVPDSGRVLWWRQRRPHRRHPAHRAGRVPADSIAPAVKQPGMSTPISDLPHCTAPATFSQ